jgi:hypothetical protein
LSRRKISPLSASYQSLLAVWRGDSFFAAFEKAVKAGDPQVGIKALCDILLKDERRLPGTDTLARNIRKRRDCRNGAEVETPPCPKCGSDKTALESAKGSTRRYVCRRCWKRFTGVV